MVTAFTQIASAMAYPCADAMHPDRGAVEAPCDALRNIDGRVQAGRGADEGITALTDEGIGELREMLADARRSQQHWRDFLQGFVADPDIIARVKEKDPR